MRGVKIPEEYARIVSSESGHCMEQLFYGCYSLNGWTVQVQDKEALFPLVVRDEPYQNPVDTGRRGITWAVRVRLTNSAVRWWGGLL